MFDIEFRKWLVGSFVDVFAAKNELSEPCVSVQSPIFKPKTVQFVLFQRSVLSELLTWFSPKMRCVLLQVLVISCAGLCGLFLRD